MPSACVTSRTLHTLEQVRLQQEDPNLAPITGLSLMARCRCRPKETIQLFTWAFAVQVAGLNPIFMPLGPDLLPDFEAVDVNELKTKRAKVGPSRTSRLILSDSSHCSRPKDYDLIFTDFDPALSAYHADPPPELSQQPHLCDCG